MSLQNGNPIHGIYLVGIGGISMSALSKYLAESGYAVCGSDLRESAQTRELRARGIPVEIGHGAIGAGVDLVIASDAVPAEDPALRFAREHGIPILFRAEAWQRVMRGFAHTIGIAGSHGKTTATAMLAHIFAAADLPFTAHIGGEDAAFGNYCRRGDGWLITEACEYKRNLLRLIPETAVLLNVDRDHLECYRDETDLKETFFAFCTRARQAIVCADDPAARELAGISFGIERGEYRAEEPVSVGERYRFVLSERGTALCRVQLGVFGRHNVENALAAAAAARQYGVSAEAIASGLSAFTGVKRRFERIGTICGAEAICDYAHHPREIAAILRTAERRFGKRPIVVFQPHTYSRTRLLMEDFVSALSGCAPILFRSYAAREAYDAAGSAAALAARIEGARYADTEAELQALLRTEAKPGDVVLFLGAGDLYDLALRLVRT